MRILLAPDKFRGSMTAVEACRAMAAGIRRADPTIDVISVPLSDGGEGLLDVLIDATNGTRHPVTVQNPVGKPIVAEFGLSADSSVAFVELASASGLGLLDAGERDALGANTFGTGQLLRAAAGAGPRRIVLGVGGSASTDGGMGMAVALGYRFLDEHGLEIPPCGANLARIRHIDKTGLAPGWSRIGLEVACDVTAPLYGPAGAAQVYAAQKGADSDQIARLDAGLVHLAGFFPHKQDIPLADTPGAGAAGGTGFGALAFLGASLRSGFDVVAELARFWEQVATADLILTGEGKLDAQTLQGKLIAGVCAHANSRGIPVIALCGTLDLGAEEIRTLGLIYAASILSEPILLHQALANGSALLERETFRIVNFLRAISGGQFTRNSDNPS